SLALTKLMACPSRLPNRRHGSESRNRSVSFLRVTIGFWGTIMSLYLLALLLGIVAGLRTMTAPAVASWSAHLGLLSVSGTWLSFMGHAITPWVFTVLALGELVVDQLPSTPSRKVPYQFGGRIVSGALCGATVGIGSGQLVVGIILGVVGAVIGTFGGAAA